VDCDWFVVIDLVRDEFNSPHAVPASDSGIWSDSAEEELTVVVSSSEISSSIQSNDLVLVFRNAVNESFIPLEFCTLAITTNKLIYLPMIDTC
jgi:hypothetical protein